MAIDLDTLTNAQTTARSEGGRIVEVRRSGLITGLAGQNAPEWLTEAALQLPATGSTIEVAGTTLRLQTHNITVADRAAANVELVYEYVPVNLPGAFDWRGNVRFSGATQQAVSRVYPDIGDGNPLAGQDIKLTFKGVTQGGEYSFLEPNASMEVAIFESLITPWTLPQQWIGKVNKNPWAGGAVGEWLCTGCSPVMVNPFVDPPDFEVTYQFQWKKAVDGVAWQPQVVYTDPETGKPPEGWKDEPTAFVTINQYPKLEFETKFP